LNRKEVFGIIVVVAFVFLLARSQTDVLNDPAAVSCPSGSNPHVTMPSEDSTAAQGTPTFVDDPCTSDCGGSEAGYNWAKVHGINDDADCETAGETSNSPSFAEGCRGFVNGDEPDEDTTDDDPNN
jgi:hypothetical protein